MAVAAKVKQHYREQTARGGKGAETVPGLEHQGKQGSLIPLA